MHQMYAICVDLKPDFPINSERDQVIYQGVMLITQQIYLHFNVKLHIVPLPTGKPLAARI